MSPRQRALADRLTRDQLIDAVAELIDAGGVEAVTMRRLAHGLGVGVTTLYGYVRTKDELLGLFADRLLGEIEAPDTALSWDEQIAAIFHEVYQVLVEHPELAQIVASRPLPGSAAQRLFRQVLAALVGRGLDDRQIRTGYEVLAAYTTGFVQQQAARNGREPGLAELLAGVRGAAANGTPAPEDGPHAHRAAFDAGLAVVLAGLAAG